MIARSTILTPTFDEYDYPLVPPTRRMSESEYVAWTMQFPKLRTEWVAGRAVILPTDDTTEDALRSWLTALLMALIVDRRRGSLYGPNFWVRLPRQRVYRTPDLCFVAARRAGIVGCYTIAGAPDAVIEIVSAESQSRDRREKYYEYERAGVREYWIVDPLSRTVETYALKNKRFVQIEAAADGSIHSRVVSGFFVRPAQLWHRPMPKVLSTLRELGLVK